MSLTEFALRRPYAVLAAVAAVVLGGAWAALRLPVDALPHRRDAYLYVCQSYPGMDAAQMEGVAAAYEAHLVNVTGVQEVASRNVAGLSLVEVRFSPSANMAAALAETTTAVYRARENLPPGTPQPVLVRANAAPVGYLVLWSESRSLQELHDLATTRVRHFVAGLPGVAVSDPFGGAPRAMVVSLDPDRLRAYHINPAEVVQALSAANQAVPAGAIHGDDQALPTPNNATAATPADLGSVPIRKGTLLRDLGTIKDGGSGESGQALVNGRRVVYLLVGRQADASTLAVADEVQASLEKLQTLLPDDVHLVFEPQQAQRLTWTIRALALQMLLGVFLAGVAVTLLRDWRTALLAVLNVPLALLAALLVLWAVGQTLNEMRLAGLAAATGLAMGLPLLSSAWRAWPVVGILAALAAVAGTTGLAYSFLLPLVLAAALVVLAAFLLSCMLTPVLAAWLRLEPRPGRGDATYVRRLAPLQRWRGVLAAAYVVGVAALGFWWHSGHARLGLNLLPPADHQFELRLRAAPGTHGEHTEELTLQALDAIKEFAGPDNVVLSVGYAGAMTPSSPSNSVQQWSSGPEEAVLRVTLRGPQAEDLKTRLRQELPRRLADWLRQKLQTEGMNEAKIAERLRGLRLSLESSTRAHPLEVVVMGPKTAEARAYAERLRQRLEQVPALRDLQYQQTFERPTLAVHIDRERAALSEASSADIARSVAAATNATTCGHWRDPASGVLYPIQVQVIPGRLTSARDLELLPVFKTESGQLLLRDVAQVEEGTAPGHLDRLNLQRVVTLTANIQGDDLGRVAEQVNQVIGHAGAPSRGVTVAVRGQAAELQQVVVSVGTGVALAAVLIFLLLTAYFQSFRLAFLVLALAPAALAGAAAALVATGTTLNLLSGGGTLLAIGVGLAGAALLVDEAERRHRNGSGVSGAVLEGMAQPSRAVVCLASAAVLALAPLAVGLWDAAAFAGLARAFLGGLLGGTLANVFLLPGFFTLVQTSASATEQSAPGVES